MCVSVSEDRAVTQSGLINRLPTLNLSRDYWIKVGNAFEARRGEVNVWTIPLPDEMIRAVREALKVDTSPRKSP